MTFLHGRVNAYNRVENPAILMSQDASCRNYVLFISDALKTRSIIGPQINNRVVVVPRSTQWKLQEFLSSPQSSDIVNLLVIGESLSADQSRVFIQMHKISLVIIEKFIGASLRPLHSPLV